MDKDITKRFAEAIVKSTIEVDYDYDWAGCGACEAYINGDEEIPHTADCVYVEAKEYLKSIE